MNRAAAAIGVLALALATTESFAADIARPIYKAPPVPVHQTYWTGCYVGGNVGYGWAPTSWSTPAVEFASHSANGAMGGVQAGCDYEFNRIVVGVQGMFDASGMKGDSANGLAPVLSDTTRVPWLGTLTGRVGITGSPTLYYAKGGAAWVRGKFEECCTPPVAAPIFIPDGFSHSTRLGWTLGAGIEHIFIQNWSVFVEYNYVRLNNSVGFTGINGASNFSYDIDQEIHSILLGVNYRF